MKELLLRTITGISLIVLVIGSILLGPHFLLAVTILIYVLAIRELYLAYSVKEIKSHMLIAVSAGTMIPLTYVVLHLDIKATWLLLPLAGWLTGYLWSGLRLPGLLAMIWISLPITSFLTLGWINDDGTYYRLIPLSVIILVWINDTFAYVTGSLFGKHHLTPTLSPGKTWEGLVGGVLFSMLGGWIIQRIWSEFQVSFWLAGAFLISIFSLLGDLFESSLKRKLNVKNMGRLLPGHGGILDRFDSLLFVAPVILIILILIRQGT